MAVIARSRDFRQPLTAVEACLLDLCDGQWADFTPDWALLSQKTYPTDVFVFWKNTHFETDFFFAH